MCRSLSDGKPNPSNPRSSAGLNPHWEFTSGFIAQKCLHRFEWSAVRMESAAVLLSTCFYHLPSGRSDSGDPRVVKFAASRHESLDPWSGVIERRRLLIWSAFYERDFCAIRETQLC